MSSSASPSLSPTPPPLLHLAAGQDRFGETRSLGISRIEFKLVAQDNPDVFILENIFHAPGGPARHLHYHQDEWFYILEGQFTMEVGEQRMDLAPGESVLGPRGVPHVWASTGVGRGRILVAFFPAGQMEAFFHIVTQANAMPPLDPALWEAHGMQLLGPPLV